jgi:hypothetical protein
MTTLAQVAPRLAKAHRERQREIEVEARKERHRQTMLLKAERLEAHRDLQLIRAYATGDRRYIERRERKLDQARREVARWRAA